MTRHTTQTTPTAIHKIQNEYKSYDFLHHNVIKKRSTVRIILENATRLCTHMHRRQNQIDQHHSDRQINEMQKTQNQTPNIPYFLLSILKLRKYY